MVKLLHIHTTRWQHRQMQPSRYSLLSAASEEADVCKERTFTVVDQQGEFVQSQGAVGRDAEQREELPGACNTKQANM